VGNFAAVPVFTPPPTPMPGFSISYLGMNTCGSEYGFRFELKNTGSVTWQSIKIYFTDLDTATTKTRTYDMFRDVSICVITNVLQNLEPNEVGAVGVGLFNYDPTGHSITATFTLYTENGLAGQSETRTISFTP
jgi:hypothetical protein